MLLWLLNLGFAATETPDTPATLNTSQAPYAQIDVRRQALTTLSIITQAPFAEIVVMNQDKYDIGDTAEFVAEFKVTRTKVLTNPTALSIIVTPPDGVPVTYFWPSPQVVNDAVGKFRALIDCTQVGAWEVRWLATGAAKCGKRTYFQVE